MLLFFGRSVRYICFAVIFMFAFVTFLTLYICSNRTCSFGFFNSPYYAVRWRKLKANRQLLSNRTFRNSFGDPNADDYERQKITVANSDFDIRGSDVIVFLHIQNTGGSVFARHMVEDLQLERPCRCRKKRRVCRCYRPGGVGGSWLFSRYTTGWRCGVHPDWRQLAGCVDGVMDEDEGRPVKRRYFFVTMLRDPVKRFLSEFWHLRRGGQVWSCPSDPTLDDFLHCPHNPAINRQTRMLSDVSLLGNSTVEEGDLILLTSAKSNLHKMSFFGLSEYPRVSQYVFEATFGLSFRARSSLSRQRVAQRYAKREQLMHKLGAGAEQVGHVNHLDAELYSYAKELLFHRFERLKRADPSSFDNYLSTEEEEEDWADKEDSLPD